MRLDIQVELKDTPGQLGNVLNVVARYGGNIQSVHHEHGRAHGEWVPVRLQLDVSDEAVEILLGALREEARVLSVLGDVKTIPYAFLLLGHVFQSQITDLTDAVFRAGSELRAVRAEVSGKEKPSAVLVEIASPSTEVLVATQRAVADLAKERGLAYVGALSETPDGAATTKRREAA